MTGNLCEVTASQAKATDSTGINAADGRSRQPRLPVLLLRLRLTIQLIEILKISNCINQLLSASPTDCLKGATKITGGLSRELP